jgi:hypothetical protein
MCSTIYDGITVHFVRPCLIHVLYKHLLETIILQLNEACLRNIIQFAYTGNITLDINSVQDLLIAANYLQIDIITQKCENFITNNIMKYENEEIIHLLHFASMYDMKSLIYKM